MTMYGVTEGSKAAAVALPLPDWERSMWQSCSPMEVYPMDLGFKAKLRIWDLDELGLRHFQAPPYVAIQKLDGIHKAHRSRIILTIPIDARCSLALFLRRQQNRYGRALVHPAVGQDVAAGQLHHAVNRRNRQALAPPRRVGGK